MKNHLYLLSFLIVCLPTLLTAQGQLVEKTTFEFNGVEYGLQVHQLENEVFEVLLNSRSDPQNVESFQLAPFTLGNFRAGLENQMNDLVVSEDASPAVIPGTGDDIQEVSATLFAEASSALIQNKDDRPLAGRLKVKHQVPVQLFDFKWDAESGFEQYQNDWKDFRKQMARILPSSNNNLSNLFDVDWTVILVADALELLKELEQDSLVVKDSLALDQTQAMIQKTQALARSDARIHLIGKLMELKTYMLTHEKTAGWISNNYANIYQLKHEAQTETESDETGEEKKTNSDPSDKTQTTDTIYMTDGTLAFLAEVDSVRQFLRPASIAEYCANLQAVINNQLSRRERKHLEVLSPLIPDSGILKDSFVVESFQLEFENGFIENILISGTIKRTGELLVFKNWYPIGFSSKRNIEQIRNTFLFSNTPANGSSYKMNLARFFIYQEDLFYQRRDFSPGNDVTKENLTDDSEFQLRRNSNNDILEALVFTDIAGVNDANPNGLLQFDIRKRFLLFSQRSPKFQDGYLLNTGVLPHFFLHGTISKIEQNNRTLTIASHNRLVNNQLATVAFAPTMDLFSQNYLKVGGDLELITFDSPSLKTQISILAGFEGALTRAEEVRYALLENEIVVRDTTAATNIATVRPSLGLEGRIFSDGRVGATLNFQASYFYLMNTSNLQENAALVQVGDPQIYLQRGSGFTMESRRDRFFFTFGIKEFFIKSSEENRGKFFFRAQFHWLIDHGNEYFYQIQTGYSINLTDLLSRAKKK